MSDGPRRLRVLFVCTHNSARRQMAEGFLPAMAGNRFDVKNAGTERTAVHPLAIEAMAERGIDIRLHTSKLLAGLIQEPWDYVVTVCDDANERCPLFPGRVKRLHWSFEDPSRATGSDADRLETFRRVRSNREPVAALAQHGADVEGRPAPQRLPDLAAYALTSFTRVS